MSAQRDRSPIWIGIADLLLCVVSVVIVAVAPTKAKQDSPKNVNEFVATIEWNVDIDADADIWLLAPAGKPVFYGSRQVGCATLDQDNRGFVDSIITLADGSQAKIPIDKETIMLRCIEPGHYELGVNLYAYRDPGNVNLTDQSNLSLKVHVQIDKLNPNLTTVFAKDVNLDRVGQTINATGFDISRDGGIALSEPRLAPVTDGYQQKATP
jgi:hypothetical protein